MLRNNTSSVVCILLIGILMLSCEENKRQIVPQIPEGNRIVLLEEFTGKGCTNCPKGSRELENLLGLYPDNLVVVSIHAGIFADPSIYNVGIYDLRTEEGEDLYTYLGPIIGYPTGVVNRTEFNGSLQQNANAWGAYIIDEIEQEPRVEFTVTTSYDSGSRLLDIEVNGNSRANLNGDIRISIMLAEDHIIDAQDDQEAGGIVQDYDHKHVLRDMATRFDGDQLAQMLSTGQSFQRSFQMQLDNTWVPDNCKVIAFVSLVDSGNDTFEVLQAGEATVLE